MTGKIFSTSDNVYQDQAKILFDYYKQAAEKIVAEEERIEKEIAVLEEEKAVLQKEIAGLWVWFFTFILFFMYFIKKKALEKEIIDKESRIEEFKKQHTEIFRDYKVSKLGVAYIPVADQIKYEDKSFIVDYTGKVAPSEVTLQLPRQNDLLSETISTLEQLSAKAPIVETSEETETIDTDTYSTSFQKLNQHDYFGKLERSLRTISYCLDDLSTTSVSLPLVANQSEYLAYLEAYATADIADNILPQGNLADVTVELSVCAYVLAIRHRGYPEARCGAWSVACRQTYTSLPSVGRARLRPSTRLIARRQTHYQFF